MNLPFTKPKPKPRARKAPARSRSARKPAARARARELRDAVDGLEQRHYDVIGLALIAAGIFLALVLYMAWDGGRVGGWIAEGLERGAGRVAYVVPVALAAWGVSFVARPMLQERTPSALNAGGILVLCGLLLAFAAQTASLGPDQPGPRGRVLRPGVHCRRTVGPRARRSIGPRPTSSSNSAPTSSPC